MIRNYYLSVIRGGRKDILSLTFKGVLSFLSVIYGKAAWCHRNIYTRGILRRAKLSIPVISVGNITWGGTGKTPLVIELAKMVQRLGQRPAVLTRGYGSDEWREITGNLPGVPVGVGSNRDLSGSCIVSRKEADVILCDDAFQHWPLKRDWDIVAVNAADPFGNGRLIPAGELREPVSALSRAQTLVLTHTDRVSHDQFEALKAKLLREAPQAGWVEAVHEPVSFFEALSGASQNTEAFRGKKAAAFCAVGAPRLFADTLKSLGIEILRFFEFPDHHAFTLRDAGQILQFMKTNGIQTVITTEKDLSRNPVLLKERLNPWILKVRLKIVSGEETLNAGLSELIKGHKEREKAYA